MNDVETLRVVVFKDGHQWCAQCLEYDIGAESEDLDDLPTRFLLTLEADLSESVRVHGEPFAGIDPAPEYFHKKWEKRSKEFMPAQMPPIDHLNLDMALCA